MQNKVLIKEIFKSIQGEGGYVGVNQVFVRFSRCNLNCNYCDTDFKSDLKEYSVKELAEIINSFTKIHSVSLTGGEPLLEIDFLTNFLPLIKHKIYLETNGVLYNNLKTIVNNIDIISMDIKLPSCTKSIDLFDKHEEFIKIAMTKELFLKVVFDENITNKEIEKCSFLSNKYNIPLILQPKMNGDILGVTSEFINEIFYKFIELNPKVRLIGQMHKFINQR